jgi:hypothetical protein
MAHPFSCGHSTNVLNLGCTKVLRLALPVNQGNPLDDQEFRWALIVNVPGASPLGCRVNHVVGPFWDELKSSAIHHEGHDWQLVHPFGSGHA